jgi:hypothetical protein
MMNKVVIGAAGVAGAVIVLGQIDVGADVPAASLSKDTSADQIEAVGNTPDVIVGVLHEYWNGGTDSLNQRVYSFGTTSCNKGNAPLTWISSNNQHPVIAQNLFRVADVNGHPRIEQLGQSWLKHGFFALAGNACGLGCDGDPGSALGVGCSDPYSAFRNAGQSNAGAKNQVDASTGFFPYPPQNPSQSDPTVDNLSYGRLKVDRNKVTPSMNPGARWFAEGQYVHPEDSPEDGGLPNNASYREVGMGSTGNINGFLTDTRREIPGIFAWVEVDDSVKTGDVGADGTFFYAYNAYNNGDGTWDYEYAVQNHNSHDSAGSFSVPIPAGVSVTNIGFHDVDYHSGEPWDKTDWAVTVGGGSITWQTESMGTNPNANALRWGTMYNFRFTANSGPEAVTATLGLWRVASLLDAPVFGPGPVDEPACAADITSAGDCDGPDGSVDALDYLLMIAQWGTPGNLAGQSELCADITGPTPGVPDGNVDSLDFLRLIAEWGTPSNCP